MPGGTRPDYIWGTRTPFTGNWQVRIDDADLRPLPRTGRTDSEPGYLYGPGTARDILGEVASTSQGPFRIVPELEPSPGAFDLTGNYRSGSVGGNLAVLATRGPAPELVRIWEPTQYP